MQKRDRPIEPPPATRGEDGNTEEVSPMKRNKPEVTDMVVVAQTSTTLMVKSDTVMIILTYLYPTYDVCIADGIHKLF